MDAEKHFELAVAHSRDALKALLLVNGGAATALIALMDKSPVGSNFTNAILYFGAGAVSAVVSSCFAYFSQLNFANSVALSGSPLTLENSFKAHRKHQIWQSITVLAVIATLIFMILGLLRAAQSVENGGAPTAPMNTQSQHSGLPIQQSPSKLIGDPAIIGQHEPHPRQP